MKISVNVKQLGRKIGSVEPVDFELDCVPHTAGELVCAAVRSCVSEYNRRTEITEPENLPDKEKQDAMARAGKIAFGLAFSEKKADAEAAQQTALEAYRDGVVRLFIDGEEPENEDSEISLTEKSEVTFIRLAMLAGRIW